MARPWSDAAIRYLSDGTICPRCDARILEGRCSRCGLDLRGETGDRIWAATTAAVAALEQRQLVIEAVGGAASAVDDRTATAVSTAPAVEIRAARPSSQAVPAAGPDPASGRSDWSVQSLLAIAGAGLVAVAAVVFAFFNPEVADPALRLAIIGPVTLLFGVGAVLTARRLRLTAESLAALSAVFLGLDVQFLADLAPHGPATWVVGGLGLLVAGVVLGALGAMTGLRAWLVGATIALVAFAPVLAGAADAAATTRSGLLAVGAVAIGLHALFDRVGAPRGSRLLAERVIATIAQLAAGAAIAVGGLIELGGSLDAPAPDPSAVLLAAVQLAVAGLLGLVAARWIMPRVWSAVGGIAVMGAALLAGASQATVAEVDAWFLPIIAGAVGAVLVAFALLARLGVWARRPFDGVVESTLRTSTMVVAIVVGAPLVLAAVGYAVSTGIVPRSGIAPDDVSAFAIASALLLLAAAATGARLLRRPAGAAVLAGAGSVIPWLVAPAIAVAVLWDGMDPPQRAVAAVVVAAIVGAIVGDARVWAMAGRAVRIAAAVLAHLLLLAALLVALPERDVLELVGLAVIGALALVARLVPRPARALHWGAGDAIALGVLAIWLERTALEPIDRLAIVAAAGALIAIAVTLVRLVPRGAWVAVLVVSLVPFLIAVGSVLVERTGWTALSTAAMAALAVVIVVSRRPGLVPVLRVGAAALVVPSVAVTLVCLGAEVLVTSGSPVVLPTVAVLVAAVLASASWIEAALRRGGIGPAGPVTAAVELSAGLTGAIAVVLALVRVASGYDTAMVVLVVVGVGAAVARVLGGRRWGWWVAAASWTGALWCALLLSGVELLEPFVLPPAVAAVVVGVVLLAMGRSGRMPAVLAVVGLGAGMLPTLLALVVVGSGDVGAPGTIGVPWRALGLALVAVALMLIAFGLRRTAPRLAVLRRPLLVGAMVGAVGAGVQAARWAVGADGVAGTVVPMSLALPTAVIAAVLAGLASRSLAGTIASPAERAASSPPIPVSAEAAPTRLSAAAATSAFDPRRWLAVPALVLLVTGPVLAIRADWGSIWALWGLMAALFALGVLTAARVVAHPTLLPPVWTTAVAGWIAAVGSWSERELRVEVFSLPMGVAVLAMGIIHLLARRRAERAAWAHVAPAGPGDRPVPRRSINAWPAAFDGSWWLLAPGILLVLVPSVLSTGTDPVTWRAIMVIALALAAILIGSIAKLAAPFFLGLAVLPIENVVVFAVQIGKGVESLPWWITLATAGAVLLAIAMNAERRSAAGAKVSRIREMR